ncbi:MAG: hypothetical protein PHE09_16665 [Oscillospiraceae bacterium]|nr:hypothetical protein [Oscillospiraceae bacterium]
MIEEELTVDEMVKALRCCASGSCNEECPYFDGTIRCMNGLMQQTADALEKLNDFEHSQCAKLLADNARLKAELNCYATPENKPLTVDELRKMDGEPVWIPIPDGSGYGDWAIVDIGAQTELLKAVGLDAAHEECNYGKTWLAYRRPPEAGEKE